MWEENIKFDSNIWDSNEVVDDNIDKLFQGTFEDFIWATSESNDKDFSEQGRILDTNNSVYTEPIVQNKNAKNKLSENKPLLNLRFLAWIVTYIVLLIISEIWSWWIKMWQSIVLNFLLFFFLVARIVYIVKNNKLSELQINSDEILDRSIWSRFKSFYTYVLVFAIFFSVKMAFNNVRWHHFYKKVDLDYWENRYIEIQNEYAWCNCFGPNATNEYPFENSEYFTKNVANKFEFEFLVETMLNIIWWKHQNEIRDELYSNINTILWKKCFGDWYELCDLSNLSETGINEIFSWAANMISQEKLQQWWFYN